MKVRELQNKVLPGRRFPEFAESWERERFDELFAFKSTNSFSRDDLNYLGGEVRNIHYGDIHTKFRSLFDLAQEDVPFINPEIALGRVPEENYCRIGDIVMADASEDYSDIGKAIEIIGLDDQPTLAGLHTLLVRPLRRTFSKGFLAYLMQSWKTRLQIMTFAQGTKVLGIPRGWLTRIYFDFPADKEQEKIAAFLTAADEKIGLLAKKKDLLEKYKKGVMQKIFAQEIRFKDNNGKDFPDWEMIRIGDLSTVTAGATPSTVKPEYWNGEIRWMNSGELNLKRVYEVENRITELGLASASTRMLPKYCVLIGLAGQGKTRGTVAMNMVELCTNQSIGAIHPNQNQFIGDFLYHNLDSRYDELRRLSTGDGGRGGLNLQIIRLLKINLPSIPEQKKIADFLSAIDKKIDFVNQQLEKTNTFKQGLLQQMFI